MTKKLFFSISLTFLVFILSSRNTFAVMCGPAYPLQVQEDEHVEISFDLSSQTNPVSCADNPNNEKCFWIVGCDATGNLGTYQCASSSTFNIPNQRLEGNRLVGGEPRSNSLNFWLEEWRPREGLEIVNYQQRACGESTQWSTVVHRRPAKCEAGTFRVVGVRDGIEIDNYTVDDPLKIKYDGNRTSDFAGIGVYQLILKRNGERVKNIWELISPVGMGERLHILNLTVPITLTGDIPLGRLGAGAYGLVVTDTNAFGSYPYCTYPFRVSEDGNNEVLPGDESTINPYQLCSQLVEGSNAWEDCQTCYPGIWTAVGCIQTDANSIVTQILQIAMGIAGGIALIMILAAGFMLSVSQGDPKRVSEARELITSAIIGLLFIVFSVTILQFIGVTLFKIPGLGG